MEYFLRIAWDDNTMTTHEQGYSTVEEAAGVVPDLETNTGWVVQCYVHHYDGANKVRAAQDCTEELLEAVMVVWQDNGCKTPPQIIAGNVEDNYIEEDGVWYPVDEEPSVTAPRYAM